jgi:hypothetical protein
MRGIRGILQLQLEIEFLSVRKHNDCITNTSLIKLNAESIAVHSVTHTNSINASRGNMNSSVYIYRNDRTLKDRTYSRYS